MIGKQKRARSFLQGVVMAVTATLIMSGATVAYADDEPPQTTPEGLKLTKHTKQRLVYVADDVDFSQYTKVLIVDCAVAFAKNWQRDYNRNERDLSRQVKDHDVTRIKEGLAAEFKKVFTETMIENGVEVVTEPGAGVIILRPAIINLRVTAPDLRSPSMTRTYARDAGQMTLYLELYDSVSSAILAQAMDAEIAGRNSPAMQYGNSVSNIAAADRVLKSWANEIAAHFGAVTNPDSAAEAETDEKPETKG